MSLDRQAYLQRRISRTDQAMKLSFGGMVFCIIVLLIFVIVQQYATQQQLKQAIVDLNTSATSNHDETRAYFKCIAEALNLSIDQRETAFDKCGLKSGSTAQTQSTGGARQDAHPSTVIATPQQPAVEPVTPQVTTSAGPDPETSASSGQPADSSGGLLSGLPIVGPVIKGITSIL